MKIIKTDFDGLVEIIPDIFQDERGYFFESYNTPKFNDLGIETDYVQDNQSFSKKGVLRGLHFQNNPHSQGKMVRVIKGKVLDVVVDLRPEKPTFGRHYKCLLDDVTGKMLYVPEGFAHGFLCLEDSVFFYKCTSLYNKNSESGIIWNDEYLNIDWGIKSPLISEKDLLLPSFNKIKEQISSS